MKVNRRPNLSSRVLSCREPSKLPLRNKDGSDLLPQRPYGRRNHQKPDRHMLEVQEKLEDGHTNSRNIKEDSSF